MNFSWDQYLGNSPALYADKALKECGLREPPICEMTVADSLGLEVKEITRQHIREFFGNLSHNVLRTVCAMLIKRDKGGCIYYNGETRLERKRLSIFHECGHEVLPWHEGHDYCCSEKDVDADAYKRMEREAFGCGSEFLMPRRSFIGDSLSLEIGVATIEQLRQRYVASFEATAIRYALTHPGLCGIVVVESSANRKPKQRSIVAPGQTVFPYNIPSMPINRFDTQRYPLSVQYFVKSHYFPKYIRPGQGIETGNLVFNAWHQNRYMKGEIPASVFGSSARWSYYAECLPLGNTGKMLVLLWLPCPQLKFNYGNGVFL
jgi:hypothetical protein